MFFYILTENSIKSTRQYSIHWNLAHPFFFELIEQDDDFQKKILEKLAKLAKIDHLYNFNLNENPENLEAYFDLITLMKSRKETSSFCKSLINRNLNEINLDEKRDINIDFNILFNKHEINLLELKELIKKEYAYLKYGDLDK